MYLSVLQTTCRHLGVVNRVCQNLHGAALSACVQLWMLSESFANISISSACCNSMSLKQHACLLTYLSIYSFSTNRGRTNPCFKLIYHHRLKIIWFCESISFCIFYSVDNYCRKRSYEHLLMSVSFSFRNRSTQVLSIELIARRDSTQQNCFVEWNRVGRCDHFEDSTRQTVRLSWVSSGDVITLKTQPDNFWLNFRPVGASRRVLNISELVEASRSQSGDVITFTARKN